MESKVEPSPVSKRELLSCSSHWASGVRSKKLRFCGGKVSPSTLAGAEVVADWEEQSCWETALCLKSYFIMSSPFFVHYIYLWQISRTGRLIPEKEYRLNALRRDHQRYVQECLAQAIFHKVLDMEVGAYWWCVSLIRMYIKPHLR